jgi:hypothetical protein
MSVFQNKRIFLKCSFLPQLAQVVACRVQRAVIYQLKDRSWCLWFPLG